MDAQLTNLSFDNLQLNQQVVDALQQMGFTIPSQIQHLAIPPILSGVDIICQAEAGTGKTLCFLVAILELGIKLHAQAYSKNDITETIQNVSNILPYAIVIVPTRELAIQIMDITTRLVQKILIPYQEENRYNTLFKEYLQPHLFIGGLPVEQDRDILKTRRCTIIVGTTGRIIQLLQERVLSLHNIKLMVMDEADKLHENQQFQPHLKKLFESITGRQQEHNKPQIICLSATYPQKIMTHITRWLHQPQHIATNPEHQLNNLEQYYYKYSKVDGQSNYQSKSNAIITLMKQLSLKQTIIFYNDKNRGENLFNDLKSEQFKPVFIHGDLTQSDRIKVMHQLRRNKANLIIATDLLSRGIDVNTLDLVIHFDQPANKSTYLHRIGRTGRFGTYGLTILLIPEDETNIFNELVDWTTASVDSINQALIKKHDGHVQKTEYFAEFLNGVSDWKAKERQLYDESKFKYFEDPQEEVVVVRKKQQKQMKAEQKSIVFDDELKEILKCEHCKQFYQQLKGLSNCMEQYFE